MIWKEFCLSVNLAPIFAYIGQEGKDLLQIEQGDVEYVGQKAQLIFEKEFLLEFEC